MTNMQWQWVKFSELSNNQLYELLRVRQEVFILEQRCVYQDLDNLDQKAWHLCAWLASEGPAPELVAYLRVLLPGVKYPEVSLGRVLTSQTNRNRGLGKDLLERAIKFVKPSFPGCDIRISAQHHLAEFYRAYGFQEISAPYDEDGIEHVDMLRSFHWVDLG